MSAATPYGVSLVSMAAAEKKANDGHSSIPLDTLLRRVDPKTSDLIHGAKPSFSDLVRDRATELLDLLQELDETPASLAPLVFRAGGLLDAIDRATQEKKKEVDRLRDQAAVWLASASHAGNVCQDFVTANCKDPLACPFSHTRQHLQSWARVFVASKTRFIAGEHPAYCEAPVFSAEPGCATDLARWLFPAAEQEALGRSVSMDSGANGEGPPSAPGADAGGDTEEAGGAPAHLELVVDEVLGPEAMLEVITALAEYIAVGAARLQQARAAAARRGERAGGPRETRKEGPSGGGSSKNTKDRNSNSNSNRGNNNDINNANSSSDNNNNINSNNNNHDNNNSNHDSNNKNSNNSSGSSSSSSGGSSAGCESSGKPVLGRLAVRGVRKDAAKALFRALAAQAAAPACAAAKPACGTPSSGFGAARLHRASSADPAETSRLPQPDEQQQQQQQLLLLGGGCDAGAGGFLKREPSRPALAAAAAPLLSVLDISKSHLGTRCPTVLATLSRNLRESPIAAALLADENNLKTKGALTLVQCLAPLPGGCDVVDIHPDSVGVPFPCPAAAPASRMTCLSLRCNAIDLPAVDPVQPSNEAKRVLRPGAKSSIAAATAAAPAAAKPGHPPHAAVDPPQPTVRSASQAQVGVHVGGEPAPEAPLETSSADEGSPAEGGGNGGKPGQGAPLHAAAAAAAVASLPQPTPEATLVAGDAACPPEVCGVPAVVRWAALTEVLCRAPHLTTLLLSDNSLGALGGIAFGRILGKNTALQHLDLARTDLSNAGCAALAAGLAVNKVLRWLSVADCGAGIEGVQAICDATARSDSAVLVLDLSGNPLSKAHRALRDQSQAKNASAPFCKFGTLLRDNATLTALDLHATYMGSESLATINEGLARNTSLRHLALEQCNVDEQACLKIQEKLGKRQPVAP
ncbi:RAN GTPase-activating protein 1 [Diplonema papillatum]|nr:RAN GTPase-activating protein 1 [Diplonema papillatum]